MLFSYGMGTVDANWHVKESGPTSYCRVYYVRSGDVIYRDENVVRKLKVDYLYVFPSTKSYEMEHDPANPLNCLFLHIDILPRLLSHLLEVPVKKGSFFYYLLNTLEVRILECPHRQFDSVLEELADSLVAYLNSKAMLQNVQGEIADTLSYIANHLSEKITVETLSRLCDYHPQYYIRLFRANLGVTPHQYLIHYRMKLAVTMLMDNRSVSETADMVGYSETRNFIRAFKKYYGYSPSQIKKYMFFEF